MDHETPINLLRKNLEPYLERNPMCLTNREKEIVRQEVKNLRPGTLWLTHLTSDLLLDSYGVDLFQEFALYVTQKIKVRRKRILDVAAGRHIRSSIALQKMGAKVTAMDKLGRSRNGIKVISKDFEQGENLQDYDMVVAIRAPEDCVLDMVEAALREGKDFIIIPSGDAFQDDQEFRLFKEIFEGARTETWVVKGIVKYNVITNL